MTKKIDLALPWRRDGRTLINSLGIPVMVALDYTSIRSSDEKGVTYNTSEDHGVLVAKIIMASMNGGDQ
jgi:hypothetical protein